MEDSCGIILIERIWKTVMSAAKISWLW
jgi:hypothetical protein